MGQTPNVLSIGKQEQCSGCSHSARISSVFPGSFRHSFPSRDRVVAVNCGFIVVAKRLVSSVLIDLFLQLQLVRSITTHADLL